MLERLRSAGAADGLLVPADAQFSATFESSSANDNGHMVPNRQKPGRRVLLDGNFARRKLLLRASEYCIWDTELAGFGLRVRPTGNYYWFVRLRHRGKHRRITLGRADELDAGVARAQARRLLAEVALDGLPKRAVVKATPILSDFVETYWEDLARHWKGSTAARNQSAWRLYLKPALGAMRVADITPADIHRWRDACAGPNEAKYNRAVPVLASLLKYAELLHLRRKGSNPCRGYAALQASAARALSHTAGISADWHCTARGCRSPSCASGDHPAAVVHRRSRRRNPEPQVGMGTIAATVYFPTARRGQRPSGLTVRHLK